MAKDNRKTINLKLDAETKNKFETLAYLKGVKMQDLILQYIQKDIKENADAIAKIEKVRYEYKKE